MKKKNRYGKIPSHPCNISEKHSNFFLILFKLLDFNDNANLVQRQSSQATISFERLS